MAIKTYSNSFIYNKKDDHGLIAERNLIEYIQKCTRININDLAFSGIKAEIKTRASYSVVSRILNNPNIVLGVYSKELSPAFKVFYSKDIRIDKSPSKGKKLFIDVTGLITLKNGYFVCNSIDKLCTYLIDAAINMIYYENNTAITSNAAVVKYATTCFMRLFCGVLDNLRVVGFEDNRDKIMFLAGVYFLYNEMGKDLKYAATVSGGIMKLTPKDIAAYTYYYNEENLASIDSFITFLADLFKMKGLDTAVYIDRWIFLYYQSSTYAVEICPAFLVMVMNAYSGTYLNGQKQIELICGQDMVNLAATLIKVINDTYDRGFTYNESKTDYQIRRDNMELLSEIM